jgi:hypothetical protein
MGAGPTDEVVDHTMLGTQAVNAAKSLPKGNEKGKALLATAISHFRSALALSPEAGGAWYNLHAGLSIAQQIETDSSKQELLGSESEQCKLKTAELDEKTKLHLPQWLTGAMAWLTNQALPAACRNT